MFARHIDAVAAVSAPVLEEHRQFGLFRDLPADKARVIWNGVRGGGPSQTTLPSSVKDGPFVFGFLGRLVPEKGIEVLLEACRLLPDCGWKLNVAGRAPDSDDRFRAQAGSLPVEFMGFTDPSAFLASIDMLVVPSIWREPFGMTVVEAFSHGIPVIGSRVGAIQDLVGAIGPEWLVPPGDVSALACLMTEVIIAGRGALPPASAYPGILERVSVERMVSSYEALYEGVLATPLAA